MSALPPKAESGNDGARQITPNIISSLILELEFVFYSGAGKKLSLRLKEKSGFSSSLPPVRQLHHRLRFFFSKGKTGWLMLLTGSLAPPPPMLMNECRPNRGRVSSSAS